MHRILYITYDGLTDPLGQSQILPYIQGLSNFGYQFTILSFEKKERLEKEGGLIRHLTQKHDIKWVPLSFTTHPPLLSKFYDAVRMRLKAFELQHKYHFNIVHCRSYIAADIGLQLKKKFGVKFFFDMRGFWADEKKDGGSWNVANPVYKRVYNYYKNKEAQYLRNADYIISLTEAGKEEMMQWSAYNKKTPVQVIPCCADMDLFSLTDKEQKRISRKNLGIAENDLVISYLGSVGTWYMLEEMLQFFKQLKQHYANAKFLFITHTPRTIIDQKAGALNLKTDFIVKQASRKEVPALVKASDINISFIKPVYSKISSSPTKLGEVLSIGIPVICNSGVGDVEQIIKKADAGYVVHDFTKADFEAAIRNIPHLLQKSPESIRNAVKDIYSLSKGIELYASCYRNIMP